MGKRGPKPLTTEELEARGSWRAAARKKAEAEAARRRRNKPARVVVDVPILDDEWIWTGIPGYDARDLAGDCVWDRDAAVHAIRFFHERLNHVKGASGPFILEPWQQAVTGNLFGWKNPDGTRRYRRCFMYVPKKQGKTPWAAGIVLYLLTEFEEPGKEIYSVAYNKEQASLAFRYAAGMARADVGLSARLKVYGMTGGAQMRSLVDVDDPLSFYRPLAAKAASADGASVYVFIGDELHLHPDGDLIGILEKGTAARDEPLGLYTSTAGVAGDTLVNQKLAYARAVRDNKGDPAEPGFDASLLPVIYEAWEPGAEDKPDWRDESTWRKANPNFGVTVSAKFFDEQVREIDANPSKLNNFLRYHLNIVTDATEAALPMDSWDACKHLPPEPKLKREPCFGGLDLSSTIDLTSFALYWPTLRAIKVWFWRPLATLRDAEDRDRVPYHHWAENGIIETCEGNAIDEKWITDRVDQIATQYGMVKAGVDRAYGGRRCAMDLIERGHELEEMAQGHFTLSRPCRELERLVVAKTLRHEHNACMRWNVACLVWRYDANNSICYDKKKSNGRIDGVAASVMAIGIAGEPEQSNLERYGIRRL